MREGKIVQYDTPEEILAHPQNRFVSDFVGADRALKTPLPIPRLRIHENACRREGKR